MSNSHGDPIELYSLRRHANQRQPPWLERMMDCMKAERRNPYSWDHYIVKYATEVISEYTISLDNYSYFTTKISLLETPAPQMKHRDMIVDNYTDAGGDLGTLRCIGVNFVTNNEAYECIQDAYATKGLEFPTSGRRVETELVCTRNICIFPLLPYKSSLS